MKNIILSLCFIIISFSFDVMPQENIYLYTMVDELPRFGETDNELYEYIYEHLEWPKSFVGDGKVIVSFYVTKEGRVEDVSIEKAPCKQCGENVKKILEKMPLWKPGTKNGNPVNVKLYLPVDFELK